MTWLIGRLSDDASADICTRIQINAHSLGVNYKNWVINGVKTALHGSVIPPITCQFLWPRLLLISGGVESTEVSNSLYGLAYRGKSAASIYLSQLRTSTTEGVGLPTQNLQLIPQLPLNQLKTPRYSFCYRAYYQCTELWDHRVVCINCTKGNIWNTINAPFHETRRWWTMKDWLSPWWAPTAASRLGNLEASKFR